MPSGLDRISMQTEEQADKLFSKEGESKTTEVVNLGCAD